MSTPKPSGITSQALGNQWFTVSWDDVAGADYYECQHQDETHTSQLRRPESALLAIAYGTRRYTKIRNMVGGVPSGWVTVTLNDRGEIVDIEDDDPDPPPGPPQPPGGLHVDQMDVPAGAATVAWDDNAAVEYWQVLLEGSTRWRKTVNPNYTFHGLTEGETYGWRVRAVNRNGTSAPTRSDFTFEDSPPPPPPEQPATPTGLTVHCITYQSGKAEWAPQNDNDGWEVWLDDDREGTGFTTMKTLVALSGLLPETTYRVNVVATRGEPGRPGYMESEPATEWFTTLQEEQQPPPPPPPVNGDLPAPKHLVVRADTPTSVQASWQDSRPDTKTDKFFYASINGRDWMRVDQPEARFTGLTSGNEYTVTVFGVYAHQLTSITHAAATVRGAH